MSYFIEDFEGTQLKGWTPSRISTGGMNDGSWTFEVKDSKIYGKGLNGGTESGYWGQLLSRPANIVGDFVLEYQMRQRVNAAITATRMGVGVVNPSGGSGFRNIELFAAGATNQVCARNFGSNPIAWPGFPSKSQLVFTTVDNILNARVIRKNGTMFYYANGMYMGQETGFTTTLTGLYVYLSWWQALTFNVEKWIDWIKFWPKEAIL